MLMVLDFQGIPARKLERREAGNGPPRDQGVIEMRKWIVFFLAVAVLWVARLAAGARPRKPLRLQGGHRG